MKRVCPNCEKETDVLKIETKESVSVRNEKIGINIAYFKCKECNTGFENTRDKDALEEAYKVYRQRHNMLQPEEIKAWRKRYRLTQKELSRILSWGDATLNRYENGALQSEAHEKYLRLAMEPHNLIKLIEDSGEVLEDEKKKRILGELELEDEEINSFEIIFEDRFGRYAPSEYSGYKNLNLSKLFNAIIFFCKGGTLKTKLNKLLFYADFKHFKDNTVSITGVQYVHFKYGPVPDNYEFFIAEMVRSKELDVDEVVMGSVSGYDYKSVVEPDLSVFSDSELKVLLEVKEQFKSYTSTQIKDFSHQEKAYQLTKNGETISYFYSDELQI